MNCSIINCNEKYYARGYCKYHYRSLKYKGILLNLPEPPIKYCSIKDCNEKHSAKGFCQKHYREYKIQNNPLVYKNIEKKRQERSRENKSKIVDILGGKCVKCGYNKNLAALEFHHNDPNEKEFAPKSLMRDKNIEIILNEIKKCILVCKNCHTEIHHPELFMQNIKLYFGASSASPEYDRKILTAP